MQSDSTPDPGTTPDNRSLTDLWRTFDAAVTDRARHGADPTRDRAYFDTADQFWQRMDKVAERYDTVNLIRDRAQVEHPHLAWDQHAAVFTTGQFAEGRTR